MRRILVTLFLLAALVAPMTVIAQEAEPVTLRVIGFESTPEEQDTPLAQAKLKVLTDFMAEHPNVTIESLEAPPEFDTQLLVDLAAGTAPDIWYQDASTLARLVDTGNVVDVRVCLDLVPELDLDRFTPRVPPDSPARRGRPDLGSARRRHADGDLLQPRIV
ncbi:MAG: hypothetical protein M5R40_05555 [Anaerolineae bacterium]|nr:hypothetical protein [Anaerolineae bacterium]